MEFSEVMKQVHRMCMTYLGNYCQHCPLCDENENCEMDAFSEKSFDAQAMESTIMDWAKKNPEPVYPSWRDGWKQFCPEAMAIPCPKAFGVKCENTVCSYCLNQPMTAEAAERLGIKPIVKAWEQ